MEFNLLLQGLITFSIFLLSYFIFSKWWVRTSSGKPPPEAGGAWPLIGHIHLLPRRKIHVKLASLADKYGPIFSIRLGFRRIVVVSSSELAKELYTVHDLKIASRARVGAGRYLNQNETMFAIAPYGPFWQQIRKLVSSELLSKPRVAMMSHIRSSEIDEAINNLYTQCQEKRDASEFSSKGVVINMKKWIDDLIFNTMLRMLVGKGFDKNGTERDRTQELVWEITEFLGKFVVADAFPFLRCFDLGGNEKRLKNLMEELDEIVEQWRVVAEECRNVDDPREKGFMDDLVSILPATELRFDKDVNVIIKATIEILIIAGAQTIADMLLSTLWSVLNHPEVIKKAQEELDGKIGRKNMRVNESDMSDLVYINAIVKENFRLPNTTVPIGVTREVLQDCVVGGYHIPKGTFIIFNLWKLHLDPKVWSEDRLEFKPERFLGTKQNMSIKGHDFELIPFGGGRRICPGMDLSMLMLQLVLANLLHAFEITRVDDHPVEMEWHDRSKPFNVVIAPRM